MKLKVLHPTSYGRPTTVAKSSQRDIVWCALVTRRSHSSERAVSFKNVNLLESLLYMTPRTLHANVRHTYHNTVNVYMQTVASHQSNVHCPSLMSHALQIIVWYCLYTCAVFIVHTLQDYMMVLLINSLLVKCSIIILPEKNHVLLATIMVVLYRTSHDSCYHLLKLSSPYLQSEVIAGSPFLSKVSPIHGVVHAVMHMKSGAVCCYST